MAQLLALALILMTALKEVREAQADLAADRGVGSSVTLPSVPAARAVAPPVRLIIPYLEMNTRLSGVRTNRAGVLGVPEDPSRAAWWSQGPAPGDKAPAVIVGHVDSREGPGIFFRLDELRRGNAIAIRRADGTTARFVVQTVRTYAKRDFPTRLVYRGTPGRASLRLITCGGAFDASRGHYRSNVIVFAAFIPPKRAPRVTAGSAVQAATAPA